MTSENLVMKIFGKLIAFTSFLAELGMVPAYAHHSAAASFDVNETIEIEGYVNEFVFKNPHVNLILTVTHDDGVERQWMATAPATAPMRRWGWTADTIREGQYLRLLGRPRRDGGQGAGG